jgi:hypothetical protein
MSEARHRFAIIQRNALNAKIHKKVSKEKFKEFLKKIGYSNVELSDHEYFLTDWNTWKIIIEDSWVKHFKYVSDFFDCDNFADYFNSSVAAIYGLNTSGRYSVELFRPSTGKHIGWHRASLIVCIEPREDKKKEVYENLIKAGAPKEEAQKAADLIEDKLVAYAYDPMLNGEENYCKVADEDIIIKNWKYRGWFLSFN